MAAIAGDTELERLVARSRLIGSDPTLVLHGGGNTSTKLVERDHLGRERRVLRIKGSGSDLATIDGAATSRGCWLDDLLPLRERDAMSDEEMVAYLARCLVEPGRAAAVDRDAPARVPAGGARRPRPRRRDLLARERARSRARRCARRSAPTSPSCRTCGPGFELSKRVAELAGRARRRARPPRARHLGRDARGVVRADARARRARARSTSARARRRVEPPEPDGGRVEQLPRPPPRPALARAAAGARRPDARSARSPTGPTSSGSRRCGARPTTCSGSARAPACSRSTATSTPRRRVRGEHGAAPRLVPRARLRRASRPGPTRGRPARGSSSRPTRTPRSRRRSTASAARAGSTSARCTTSSTGRSSSTS